MAQKKSFTLEQASGRGESISLRGRVPSWSWAPDGVHLVKGRGKDVKWVHPETFAEIDPPAAEKPDEAIGKARAAALAALAGLTAKEASRASVVGVASADETARLYRHSGELFFHRDDQDAVQLTAGSTARHELAELAPDGSFVAFVQANDLHLVETATAHQRAVTSTGGPDRFNGKLDWVYQEEIYGRGDFKAFWWSPDSSRVAFLSLDESAVHDFTVVDHIEEGHFRVKPEVTKYPKPGDPNPTVRVGVAHAATGAVTWLDLSKYADDEPLVVTLGWTPDGSHVLYQVQNRIQSWLELCMADPESGVTRTLIRETSKAWVNDMGPPMYLDDGSFLWLSERTGWKHVYHYKANGDLVRPVTKGEWAIGRVLEVNEDAHTLRFTGTKDGAVDSNVYETGLHGEGMQRLTSGAGQHSASFREDGAFFIDRSSSLASPSSVRLCSAKGEVLRELGSAKIAATEEYRISPWELIEISARDGFALDAALLKPTPFDMEKSYPVWIPTYSGPNAPSVRNRWNGSTWYQFLAQNGIAVLQVNVRTASGKGQWTTEQGYEYFGIQELADLEDAVDWLTEKPWADATRVGITGYSYGGFITGFALTHSKKFALGIAGGGVYDWRLYDTIYTERYMNTPQNNPEGYDATSVLKAAGDLHGHLVLHAGVMDDNVHMQNTMQLVYKLQKANKKFDLMLYPQNRHGVRDGDQRWFSRQMEWDAIREYLGGARDSQAKPVEAGQPKGS
jgi:dipeptidyl-peptidase 4